MTVATMLTGTATGWKRSGPRPTRPAQILECHGDPFNQTKATALDATVHAIPIDWIAGLMNAGYTVHSPWFGANWGGGVDPHGMGGHGIGVIDTVFPAGKVHVIGTSMGGGNAVVWASKNVGRVASLTLISPGVDTLAQFDKFDGDALLGGIAEEIAAARCGDENADHATLKAQLESDGDDNTTIRSALAPIAEKIWTVCATDDPLVVVASVQAFAAAVGIPTSQAIFFDTGQAQDRHPAPYHLPEWDPLRPLRQVARWDR